MHKHHGALRLLVILVCVLLVGAAVYLVLVYGMGRSVSQTATSTAEYFPVAGSSSTGAVISSRITNHQSSATTTNLQLSGQGITVVTSADNGQTITLSKNEHFVIQLSSNLKWTVVFDPSTGITHVGNTTTSAGQGVYEADQVGTTVMHATGAPICNPGQACPDFLLEEIVTFNVK
jgi:predicted secreted protein